jgi:hypothetical protein
MERSKAAQFRLVGKRLRAALEDTKDQLLPDRWIDLIRRLDEKERQQSNDSPAHPLRRSDEK